MATIYQVSELAGVSLATVSRVMNNNARVSDKTKQKVLDAMKELNYRPNATARSLASNVSNSIGLLVSELHGPFFGQMMSGVEAELRAANKHVIITTGHVDEKREKDGIEFLLSRNCDALILHAEAVSDEYLIELSKGKVPIVLINRYVPELSERCIYLDNEQGGYLATKAVIEKGHKNIAYISGPALKQDAQQRLHGHQRALAEAGIPFNESLLAYGNYTQASGSESLLKLLASDQYFSALVCGNDEMASGAMTTARENNIQVPEQLSIVGFDNIVYASYLYPTLSTVDFPIYEMGHMAAKLILKDVYKQKNVGVTHLFEPSFIERNSAISI